MSLRDFFHEAEEDTESDTPKGEGVGRVRA
jgi:hypothetical protein